MSVRFDGRDISEREFRTDWRGSRVLRAIAAVGIALALLMFGAGIATASAQPGDRLWPAAKLVEDARLAFAGEGRAAVHAELANARLDDMLAALAAGDVERAGLAAAEFSHHTALAAAGGAKPVLDPEYQARVLAMLYRGACDDAARPGCAAVAAAWHIAGAAYDLEPDADPGASTGQAKGPSAPAAGRSAPVADDEPTTAGQRPSEPSAARPAEPPKGPPSDPPGKPGDPPGKPADPPGKPADPPGKPADPPGKPEDPPGKPEDPPGKPEDPPGKPDAPPAKPPAEAPRATPADPPPGPPAEPGEGADPAQPNRQGNPPERDEAAQRGASDD